ncbi:MAG: AAA family ATPase [Clostridiales bacterium]|nr:AAA family ATPase [Clostridiales bacterium]
MRVSLIGMSGCGKTTVGNIIAKILKMDFIDIDSEIVKKHGSIDKIFSKGENVFRKIETEVLKEAIKKDNCVISTGGGIILDKDNRLLLKDKTKVIYISRQLDDIIKSTNFSDRPLLKNNEDAIYELFKNREKLYLGTAEYVLNSNNILQDTIKNILEYINLK